MKEKSNVILKKGGTILERHGIWILIVLGYIVMNQIGIATSTSMPWEGPLDKLVKSFTGPVARAIGVLAICTCGGMMAFGEMGSAMKKMLNIVLGLSIIFSAASWGLPFFGFSGSVLM